MRFSEDFGWSQAVVETVSSAPQVWHQAPEAESFPQVVQIMCMDFPLGDWVLTSVCAQLRQWRDQGLAVPRVSVNLSARQFQHRGLAESVDRRLADFRLSPEDLHLEIAESAAMKNVELTIRNLQALRRLGIRVLMDDFGSGNASITSL